MRTDVDSFLLDRLFQPLTDRTSAWTTCFGLARLSLGAAVLLQFVVLMGDLQTVSAPVQRAAAAGVTLLALFGAQQAWSLIARTERQARPGSMNLRRITLRWQRVAWLAVTAWSIATGMAAASEAGIALCGASLGWLGLIYFVSCTPSPPPVRREQRQVFAEALICGRLS